MAGLDFDIESILNSLDSDTIENTANSLNAISDDDKISHTQHHVNKIVNGLNNDIGPDIGNSYSDVINAYETNGRNHLQNKFDSIKNKVIQKQDIIDQTSEAHPKSSLTKQIQALYNQWKELMQDKANIETETDFMKGRASGLITPENYLFYTENPEAVKQALKTGKYSSNGEVYTPTNLEIDTHKDIFEK